MPLSVQIVGGREFSQFGLRMRSASPKARAATRRKLEAATKPLQRAIRREVVPTMPKGYEATFAKSLRFRVAIRTGYWAAVSLTTASKGSRGPRQIRQLDKGVLRHPVFGRFRVSHKQKRFIENPWVAQSVLPGFWSRPVEKGKPEIRREISKVIVDSLRESVKG